MRVMEYIRLNWTTVHAYVLGLKDFLKNFMRGGNAVKRQRQQSNVGDKSKKDVIVHSSMKEEVYTIQKKQECKSKRSLLCLDEVEDTEVTSDPGATYDGVEKDYRDWYPHHYSNSTKPAAGE